MDNTFWLGKKTTIRNYLLCLLAGYRSNQARNLSNKPLEASLPRPASENCAYLVRIFFGLAFLVEKVGHALLIEVFNFSQILPWLSV